MTRPHDSGRDLPADLRLQLRGLRQGQMPQRDLWPGIAARLAEPPARAPAQVQPDRRMARALPALATAAALVLAIGLGWQPGNGPGAPAGTAAAPAAGPAPLLREAEAMTREYQGALRELTASRPPTGAHPDLLQLDASADRIRQALQQDPDARFLLRRLQRIHAQRLDLTRRYAQA